MDILLQFIYCLVITDFITGLIHWAEDNYGEEHWPIIGKAIITPNIAHHYYCRNFVKYSWFYSARELLVIGIFILYSAYLTGILHWTVVLVVLLGINANEIHKWSHRKPDENGKIIALMQKLKLIQTPKHHLNHHRNDKDSHYCTLTNFLNPILDGLMIWRIFECLLLILFGIFPRDDSHKKRQDYAKPLQL